MLFASASFPLTPTDTFDRKRIAVFTNVAAGRAWSATSGGRATTTSELACTARLLGRPRHVLQVLPRRGHHGRGDRTPDEWGADQADVAVAPPPSEGGRARAPR